MLNLFKSKKNTNPSKFFDRAEYILNPSSSLNEEDSSILGFLSVLNANFGFTPHVRQLEAGLAMSEGYSVNMLTGEGKTISLAISAFIGVSLYNKKQIICSSNSLLSKRDFNNIKQSFMDSNISVSFFESEKDLEAEIVYSSFENLAQSIMSMQGSPLLLDKYISEANLLIDEIDTVIIDMGMSPYYYSKIDKTGGFDFDFLSSLSNCLEDNDFGIDDSTKNVFINNFGIDKIKRQLDVDVTDPIISHPLNLFIKGNRIMVKDVDYAIVDSKICVIDQNTKTTKIGYEFVNGLQQIIQKKENVELSPFTYISNQITTPRICDYFHSSCGCSGTAIESKEAISIVSKSETIEIPPFFANNVSSLPSRIFTNKDALYSSTLSEIEKLKHNSNSPILVICETISEARKISSLLKDNHFEHSSSFGENINIDSVVLSKAGTTGTLTVATTQAGRGVDIKLDNSENKGLQLITVGAFLSERAEKQANGRVGRHGEPGSFQNFYSLEDKLVVDFGGSNLRKISKIIEKEEETEIEGSIFRKLFISAQKESDASIMTSLNNVLEFDNLISIQRDAFLKTKHSFLKDKDFSLASLVSMIPKYIDSYMQDGFNFEMMDGSEISSILNEDIGISLFDDSISEHGVESTIESYILEMAEFKDISPSIIQTGIYVLDQLWDRHYSTLIGMKDGIHFQALNNKDPFSVFKEKSFHEYHSFSARVSKNMINNMLGAGYSLLSKLKNSIET